MKIRHACSALIAGASVAAIALVVGGGGALAATPVFTATPLTVAAGGTETINAVDLCPAPVGAGDWVAIIKVAQGGNPEISYQDFTVATDGSWGGTMTLPKALAPGAAQLTGACFDAFHTVSDEVDYTTVDLTITAPTSSSASAGSSASSSTGVTSAGASASTTEAGGGTLANTGIRDAVPLTAFALLALLGGAGLVFAGRARRRAH